MQNQTTMTVKMVAVSEPVSSMVQSFAMTAPSGADCTSMPLSISLPVTTSGSVLVTDKVKEPTAGPVPATTFLASVIKIVTTLVTSRVPSTSVLVAQIIRTHLFGST